MRIYISNLPFSTTDKDLTKLFEAYAQVESAVIIRYQRSMRSKGYGFVQINGDDSQRVIESLNGTEYQGRILTVKEALPRKENAEDEANTTLS